MVVNIYVLLDPKKLLIIHKAEMIHFLSQLYNLESELLDDRIGSGYRTFNQSGIVLVESSKNKAYGLVKQSSASAVLSFAFQKLKQTSSVVH